MILDWWRLVLPRTDLPLRSDDHDTALRSIISYERAARATLNHPAAPRQLARSPSFRSRIFALTHTGGRRGGDPVVVVHFTRCPSLTITILLRTTLVRAHLRLTCLNTPHRCIPYRNALRRALRLAARRARKNLDKMHSYLWPASHRYCAALMEEMTLAYLTSRRL